MDDGHGGLNALCDPERYLVAEADPEEHADDRISVFEENTGALIYGRRCTDEERQRYWKEYQQTRVISHPFSIGYRGHLSRCPRWDGRPFKGWVEPSRRPARVRVEPVIQDQSVTDQEEMTYE